MVRLRQALAGYREMDVDVGSIWRYPLRATRGAGAEMVLATHASDEKLWLWRWPEDQAEPETPPTEVFPEKWVEPTDTGEAWLGRVDGILMAAWAHGDHLGFAWTAGRTMAYPRPHVRVAILDRATFDVIAQPHLRSRTTDFAFPALAVNRAGTPGLSVHYDGDDGFPGHAVGVLLEPCTPGDPWRWDLVKVAESDGNPDGAAWGDYLSIVQDGADPDGWVTTGYTLDADGAPRVHLVRFRSRP